MTLTLSTPTLSAPCVHTELPATGAAVRAARAATDDALTRWRVPRPTIEDALVVVSELVTNALLHGCPDSDATGTTIGLRWEQAPSRFAEAIRLAVTDHTPLTPPLVEAITSPPTPAADLLAAFDDQNGDEDEPEIEHGRGLGIVHSLSSRIDVTETGDGKTVTAVLVIPEPSANAAA